MTNNLVPIIFFGSMVLLFICAVMFIAVDSSSIFKMMKGGGCGCKNNSFLVWGTGILGFGLLLVLFNIKFM